MGTPYPADLQAALDRWEASKDFAVRLNELSANKVENVRAEKVALEALWIIHFDATSLHLVIKDMVLAGWSFAAPILLRSAHDGLCAMIAIANWNRPDFMAFKYFHARHKETLLRPRATPEPLLREARDGVDNHKAVMASEDRQLADQWLADRRQKNYWFQDEFESPLRILEEFTNQDLVGAYRRLSSPTHFGFAGLRLFRDDPTDLTIGPRPNDFRSMRIALNISARVLIEITRVRAAFETVDLTNEERNLKERWEGPAGRDNNP